MSNEIAQLIQKLRVAPCFLFLFLPAFCQAQQSCPWLNAATAGGILEGEVTMTVFDAHAKASSTQANEVSNAGPLTADPLTANYSGDDMTGVNCVFVRRGGPAVTGLRIGVRTVSESKKEFATDLKHCGVHATPMKAIGNEAVMCGDKAKSGERVEKVVGHVRNQIFSIRISTNNPSITEALLREKIRIVAEEVAGNLF